MIDHLATLNKKLIKYRFTKFLHDNTSAEGTGSSAFYLTIPIKRALISLRNEKGTGPFTSFNSCKENEKIKRKCTT